AATYRVSFLDAASGWGSTRELSAKQAGDAPVTVRPAPCGSARARFLDARGRPLADFHPGLFLDPRTVRQAGGRRARDGSPGPLWLRPGALPGRPGPAARRFPPGPVPGAGAGSRHLAGTHVPGGQPLP